MAIMAINWSSCDLYRQAENVMLLELDVSPPTMFMLNLNGPHLDRAYTPRLIPDLLANVPLRERSGASACVRKSQSWWASGPQSPACIKPPNARCYFGHLRLRMFSISKCALLRSTAQVPGATCITYGLVLIVHRPDIRTSESFSFSATEAVLCCLSSTGQPPLEQPLTPGNAPAHRAGPRFSLAQRERGEILCLDLR